MSRSHRKPRAIRRRLRERERERERDGNLNGWLSFAGISCDGGLIGNGKWKIDNEKWKVENFCAFSVF